MYAVGPSIDGIMKCKTPSAMDGGEAGIDCIGQQWRERENKKEKEQSIMKDWGDP